VSGQLSPASGELAVGSRVAGYVIEGQIGRGGMAVVYRASDTRLNRTVALKVLAPDLAGDTAFRQRFVREMRAAASVDHPHIVPVFDAGEADGALFIAMRLVIGQDLRTLLDSERRLPAERVADIVAQIASALDEAHSRGLVHRDVKPGNILISAVPGSGEPDHVYLSDFGLSKPALSSAQLTLTGQFLGTLDYMAPEQVEGRAIDGRADLYALGCTAFEMLTGAPPFKRDQGLAVLWAQLQAPPPSLRALRPDLPPAIDQVIARALAKSPNDRYRSCMTFATALRAACGLGQAEPGSPAAASAPGPATERARIPEPHPPASRPALPLADPPTNPQPRSAPPPATGPSSRPAPPPAPGPRSPAPARRSGPQRRPAGSWPPAPPRLTSPSGQPDKARKRGSGARVAAIAACVALLAIAGVAVTVLRSHSSPPPARAASPADAGRPAASQSLGPAATVRAYFSAINDHDYPKAWSLGGKNAGSSYNAFVQGFDGTARDNLTIVSVDGNVVTVRLAATQTDGSVKSYQGTYTVTNGVITQSRIEQAG